MHIEIRISLDNKNLNEFLKHASHAQIGILRHSESIRPLFEGPALMHSIWDNAYPQWVLGIRIAKGMKEVALCKAVQFSVVILLA